MVALLLCHVFKRVGSSGPHWKYWRAIASLVCLLHSSCIYSYYSNFTYSTFFRIGPFWYWLTKSPDLSLNSFGFFFLLNNAPKNRLYLKYLNSGFVHGYNLFHRKKIYPNKHEYWFVFIMPDKGQRSVSEATFDSEVLTTESSLCDHPHWHILRLFSRS